MAAGAWYTSAGIGDANITVAPRTIQRALQSADKNREVLGHPVVRAMFMRDEGLGQLMGALGVSIALVTSGGNKLASGTQGTAATPTNFSASNASTVTPARRDFARDVGDFGLSVQQALLRGDINTAAALITLEGLACWWNDLLDRVMALASSATFEIGATATAITFEELQDGIIDFKDRGAGRGPALGLLSVQQAKDLMADARALGGAVQFSADAAAAIQRLQNGAYLGTIGGVDFYLNSEFDTNAGDDLGMLWTDGAFMSKHQKVKLQNPAFGVTDVGWYTTEMSRPGGGVTRFEHASHNAVGILEAGYFAAIRSVSP